MQISFRGGQLDGYSKIDRSSRYRAYFTADGEPMTAEAGDKLRRALITGKKSGSMYIHRQFGYYEYLER